MRHRFFLVIAVALALPLCTVSCTVHKVDENVQPPVVVPSEFSDSGGEPTPDRWWETLQDSRLDSLVERALSHNLHLQEAWARLEQAHHLAVKAGADLSPQISVDAGVSRSRTQNTFDAASPLRTKSTDSLYSLTFSASYEVDIWKRLRSLQDAATLDVVASRDDFDAVAITLVATIGDTWYSIIEQHAQLKLLQDQIRTSETFLDLVKLRFSKGQASALDVYQQRTQVATVRGQQPPAQSSLEVLEHQLAVLLGQAPLTAVAKPGTRLPDLPPLPQTGLPADLLARRPDVRAAHVRLVAADHQVASAIADRLPALRLSASSAYKATEPSETFNNWIWSIAGNLTQPIFEGGRRAAEVKRTQAVKKERLVAYGKIVLTAFQEVEDALARERQQHKLIANLDEQIRLATATLEQARGRYVNGLSDYLPVLTALQDVQRLEREQLRTRRDLISFRISLYRALGGSWARQLSWP